MSDGFADQSENMKAVLDALESGETIRLISIGDLPADSEPIKSDTDD